MPIFEDQESKSASVEFMPEGMVPNQVEAFERASIDVQIATAHRYPRSMEEFKKRALNMVSLDQETAASCIYRVPVGDGKTAEGMSIRMAEIVAACYGNIRVMSMVVEQTAVMVKCRAVAHDLESNYLAAGEAIESTVKKNGEPYGVRQRIVVAKAALAKAHRDAIFKVVPRALCKTIMAQALRIEAGGRSLDQRRTSAHDWVKSLGIDAQRVWAILQVKGPGDLTDDKLVELLGLRTALNDNEATLDETFPPLTAGEAAATPETPARAEPPKRSRKTGVAGATAPAQSPAEQAPAPTAQAPAAPAPATPPPAERPKAEAPAEKPFTPVLTKIKPGESITATGCKVVEVTVRKLAGKPSAIVELKDGFSGTVYHLGGAKDMGDGVYEVNPAWALDGKVTVKLTSRTLQANPDGSGGGAIACVDSVTVEAPAQGGLSL